MNRHDFVYEIADRSGLTMLEAKKALNAIEDVVMECIATEDSVRFSFGEIGGKTVAPRKYKDFKTGETKMSKAKSGQPYYKPSTKAKE